MPEIGDLGQRDDHVPVGLRRQPIDEIDDAVLESADVEAVHHVRDAADGIGRVGLAGAMASPPRFRKSRIDRRRMSPTNACSVAAPALRLASAA